MSESGSPRFRSIKLYNNLKSEVERLIDQILTPLAHEPEEDIHFPFDMYIEGEELVIEVEMPGLEKGQINIEGIDKFLEISGEKDTVKRKYKYCIGLERTNGKFKKLVYIERSVNMQNVTALLDDGVLTIRLPLVEEKRGKKIINIG
jgi:HSP20 family protein